VNEKGQSAMKIIDDQTHHSPCCQTSDANISPKLHEPACWFPLFAGSPIQTPSQTVLILSLVALCVFPVTLRAQSSISDIPRQHLKGHLRPEILQTPVVARVTPTTQLTLTIALPIKDMAALTETARQISDPNSPLYRKYLSPDQFGDMFGAAPADYQTLIDWGRANNFTVTAHKNRFVATVVGSAADVETALGVHLHYRLRPDGTEFFAPDAEPSLNLALPVEHVSGLENFDVPKSAGGSGTNGAYQGTDFRNAYAASTTLTGAGQKIGILMLDGFSQSDINSYAKLTGQTFLPVQQIPVSTGTNPQKEGNLDVAMALSMAPAAQIIVFPGTAANATQILTNMAARPDIKQLSSSWFFNLTSTGVALMHQLAMQGQSFFQATGDSGAVPPNYFQNAPLDIRLSPWVTLVGGTSLNMSANGASYGTLETAWSSPAGGSSGGYLPTVPIPSYQKSIAGENGASATARNYPDVSAQGAGANFFLNGALVNLGGTSQATPLWAGFMALVNQFATSQRGAPGFGFANPALYAIASSGVYGVTFHDVDAGCTPSTLAGNIGNQYCAWPGYDLATGLGSPQAGLINALAGVPSITSISPSVGPQTGGTVVTMNGIGLTPNMLVVFGDTRVSVSCLSPWNTECFAGPTPPGTGSFHIEAVVNGFTSIPSAADLFSYQPFPYGTLSPSSGPVTGGTVVTVTGANFSTVPGATTFVFSVPFGANSPATNVTCRSTTVCTLTVPPCTYGACGNDPNGNEPTTVIATVNGLTSSIANWEFILPPAPTPPVVTPPKGAPPKGGCRPGTCQ
jgi:subtilase family serine protease